jgi:hypothetical protein
MAGSFVDIRINEQQMAALRAKLVNFPTALNKILVGSINATAKTAKAQVVKELKAGLSIQTKSVKSRVRVRFAKPHWQAAAIFLDDKPLSLQNFFPRQNKKGVSYKEGKKGSRQLLPHAFIQTANNARQVFKRRAPGDHPQGHILEHAGAEPNKDRYPIDVQRLKSIRQLFYQDSGLPGRLQKAASVNLLSKVDGAIKKYLWRKQKFGNK